MRNKREKFILFGKPAIGKEEIKAVTEVLKSGWIGMGPKCIEFEKLFAEYVGAKYAISVSSCTAALHLSLLASGVKPEDEVITTPFTFVATMNAIEYTGARPILVDIDPKTLNIDPKLIEKAITKKTKAMLPVHFGGLVCDMNKIFVIANKHNLFVVEDAAHAVGSRLKGKMVGSFPKSTACFSFYPNKNITSIEGGMVTTNSPLVARKVELMRIHGMDNEAWKRYRAGKSLTHSVAVMAGFKYNMTDIEAAVGICQLKKIESSLKTREEYAKIYDRAFSGLPCSRQERPIDISGNRHSLHLYLILLNLGRLNINRDTLVQEIRDRGIGATVHYHAAHLHPYFKNKLGYKRGDLPQSESVSDRIMTLPLTPSMSLRDAHYVADTVREIVLSHQLL